MTEVVLSAEQFSQLWDLVFCFSLIACFGLGAIFGGGQI